MVIREVLAPYNKLIITFLIILTILIVIGYAFIFNYYKDIKQDNYIIITCKNPNNNAYYEERYNNLTEFQNARFVCGVEKIANSIKYVDDLHYNITIK